jgi:UDP-N-acetylmuramoylalanine--D-glutamate ligase
MLDKLRDFFADKRILLLGFGLEGQSTLRLLERLDCAESVTVWEQYHHTTPLPDEYDVIMKSPGIPLFQRVGTLDPRVTGQADLFLRFCENRVAGITGTKGKSTTSSLLHHILKGSLLIGNIGVPPFDVVESLRDEIIVFELSCHQLEYCRASPHIAIFLNLFEEHLDHYIDFAHYRAAKENIFRFQKDGDVLIRGEDVPVLTYPAEPGAGAALGCPKLRGEHNRQNIAVAVKAAVLLGADEAEAIKAAFGFGGLEHRLELFAEIGGAEYVNDSISTIPAAAIAAVEAFPETDTLIIGGMDRGIDYSALAEFLLSRPDINVIGLPDTGHKFAAAHHVADMEEAVALARKITKRCCVLSPAAASYGFYKNFEERGRHFKELVQRSPQVNRLNRTDTE